MYPIDIDADGDMDVLSASSLDHTIAWYENDGEQNFKPHLITNQALGVSSIFAADIDSDGDMDLISASRFDNTIAWFENDGLADPLFTRIDIDTSTDAPSSVYVADMDGDGDMDIVSASRTDDKIVWFENDGAFDPSFSHEISIE